MVIQAYKSEALSTCLDAQSLQWTLEAARIGSRMSCCLDPEAALSIEERCALYGELALLLRQRIELVASVAVADEGVCRDAPCSRRIVQSTFRFVNSAAEWLDRVAMTSEVVELGSVSDDDPSVIADDSIRRHRQRR
jgi:hypothetical protein